jgi:hypothetical protein
MLRAGFPYTLGNIPKRFGETTQPMDKDNIPTVLINIIIFFAVTYGIYKWRSNPHNSKYTKEKT